MLKQIIVWGVGIGDIHTVGRIILKWWCLLDL